MSRKSLVGLDFGCLNDSGYDGTRYPDTGSPIANLTPDIMDRLAFLRNALYEINIKTGFIPACAHCVPASSTHIPLVVSPFGLGLAARRATAL